MENKLKYEIVRNCEPETFTPLWETISFIEMLYPDLKEDDKLSKGKNAILDLVDKGFIELYLGGHFENKGDTRIKKSDIHQILDQKKYWFSELAPEKKHVELFLTPLGFDVAIGKLTFEQTPW